MNIHIFWQGYNIYSFLCSTIFFSLIYCNIIYCHFQIQMNMSLILQRNESFNVLKAIPPPKLTENAIILLLLNKPLYRANYLILILLTPQLQAYLWNKIYCFTNTLLKYPMKCYEPTCKNNTLPMTTAHNAISMLKTDLLQQ